MGEEGRGEGGRRRRGCEGGAVCSHAQCKWSRPWMRAHLVSAVGLEGGVNFVHELGGAVVSHGLQGRAGGGVGVEGGGWRVQGCRGCGGCVGAGVILYHPPTCPQPMRIPAGGCCACGCSVVMVHTSAGSIRLPPLPYLGRLVLSDCKHDTGVVLHAKHAVHPARAHTYTHTRTHSSSAWRGIQEGCMVAGGMLGCIQCILSVCGAHVVRLKRHGVEVVHTPLACMLWCLEVSHLLCTCYALACKQALAALCCLSRTTWARDDTLSQT